MVQLGERVRLVAGHRSWAGVALGGIAIGYALLARVCVRRPTRRLLAVAAFVLCLVAVSLAAPDPWPTIQAVTSVIAVAVVVGGELRRPVMTWVAWVASGVLTVLIAGRLGVAPRDLPAVPLAWGVLATVGGLALDDVLAGRRPSGAGVRAAWLVPPVALGTLAVPASLAFIAGSGEADLAVWALVGAAIYLAIAVQLRAGSVTVTSWALLTFAATLHSPRDPTTITWVFVPLIAGLVVAGRILRPRGDTREEWLRWDLPPLVVAHGTGVLALTRAAALDQMPVTWTAIGGVALIAAIWWRLPVYAAIACALVNGAAWAAGPGWLSLSLSVTSLGAGVAAVRTPAGSIRATLLLVAAGSAAGAGYELGLWRGWTPEHEARVAAIASATLAIAAASVVRWTRATRDWALAVTALAVVTAIASVSFAVAFAPEHGPRLFASCAALIVASAAVALGMIARPLAEPALRPFSTGALTAAGGLAWYGFAIPPDVAAWVAAGVGVVATIAEVSVWRVRPRHEWSEASLVLVAGAMTLALIASLVAGDRSTLEAVLVLTGIVAAALGIGSSRRWLLAAAPGPLTIAWLLFASESLADHPPAFTVPIGIAILVVAAVGRAAACDAATPNPPELRVLEFAGMAFVVSGGLVEAVATSPTRGLGALVAAVAIAIWGAMTRVRRRVAFGACVAALAAFEIPVVSVIPTIRSVTAPGLWAGLVIAGVVILTLATGMERGRARLRAALGRVDELMEGWE
jgi:hypothetical protein